MPPTAPASASAPAATHRLWAARRLPDRAPDPGGPRRRRPAAGTHPDRLLTAVTGSPGEPSTERPPRLELRGPAGLKGPSIHRATEVRGFSTGSISTRRGRNPCHRRCTPRSRRAGWDRLGGPDDRGCSAPTPPVTRPRPRCAGRGRSTRAAPPRPTRPEEVEVELLRAVLGAGRPAPARAASRTLTSPTSTRSRPVAAVYPCAIARRRRQHACAPWAGPGRVAGRPVHHRRLVLQRQGSRSLPPQLSAPGPDLARWAEPFKPQTAQGLRRAAQVRPERG